MQGRGKEFPPPFFKRQLQPDTRRPYQPLPTQTLPDHRFIAHPLPPEWAVLVEEGYFPMCTWGGCTDTHAVQTSSGEIVQGNLLMMSSLPTEEAAAQILLYHLEHSHGLKNVVSPYQPYGEVIKNKKKRKVWGE